MSRGRWGLLSSIEATVDSPRRSADMSGLWEAVSMAGMVRQIAILLVLSAAASASAPAQQVPYQPPAHTLPPPPPPIGARPGDFDALADQGIQIERDRPAAWELAEHRRLDRAIAALRPQRKGVVDAYVVAPSRLYTMLYIGLLTAYSSAVLRSWRRGAYVAALLTALYGVLYILLSLEAYSLLIGSLLLFVALAVVMFLTRRLDCSGLRGGIA